MDFVKPNGRQLRLPSSDNLGFLEEAKTVLVPRDHALELVVVGAALGLGDRVIEDKIADFSAGEKRQQRVVRGKLRRVIAPAQVLLASALLAR